MPPRQLLKSHTKKKYSYAPIMLTSKAMKPIERAQENQSLSLGTKFRTRLHKNNLIGNPTSLQEFSEQFEKQKRLADQNEDFDYETSNEGSKSPVNGRHYHSFNEKPASTSVIRVEFNRGELSTRKNHSRYKDSAILLKVGDDGSLLANELKNMKVLSCTNTKTHDSFYKKSKIKPYELTFCNFKQKIYEKKMVKLDQAKQSEDWNKYLNKYYLNIKKVDPSIKREESDRQAKSTAENSFLNGLNLQDLPHPVSVESRNPVVEQSERVKPTLFQVFRKDEEESEKIERIRSSTVMHAGKSKGPKNFSASYNKKIETDIMTKRVPVSKKDHFVFGLGDSQNKNSENPTKVRFQQYKDYLWKVNFSNGLYVRLPDEVEKPYKIFVGRGNNSAVIKGIIRRRFWWQCVDKPSEANFVWTQLRVNDFIKSQKKHKSEHLINHSMFQTICSNSISKKESKVENLEENILLHSKILKGKDLKLWKAHYNVNHAQEDKMPENINQKRLKTLIKKKRIHYLEDSYQLRVHNHFECNYFLGNKKALFYAMRKYYTTLNQNPFDFIPLTFHIAGGLDDPQYQDFLEVYNRISDERMKNRNIQNIWIVKPGEVTNRGRGITVCATLDEIKIRLRSKQKNSDGSLRTYILQKYIQRPLLYHKRKFDIRHYMLMNCTNGQIKGYWYSDGYIRTTSTEYNIKNCKDLYTHLTNDAIQQNSSDYGKFEKGNKVSYEDFNKYLNKFYQKKVNFFEDVIPQMKKLTTDSIRATYNIVEPHKKEHNFELFGLDFMLDENFKVYLIEVNTNPCLETSCPLLSKIISQLLENVFKTTIDPLFPPPYEWPSSKKFQMGENALADCKLELIFDEIADSKQLEALQTDKASEFSSKLGKVEEENDLYDEKDSDAEWVDESSPEK